MNKYKSQFSIISLIDNTTFVKMAEDEFFVYLNSQENPNEYPTNTPSSFSNKIRPVIELKDDYEVALHSYYFPPRYYHIKGHDKRYYIRIFVKCFDENNISQSAFRYDYIPGSNITGDDLSQCIKAFDKDFKAELTVNQVIDFPDDQLISYDPVQNRVTMKTITPPKASTWARYDVQFSFSTLMAKFLGVDPTRKEPFHDIPVFINPPSITKIDIIWVYTDIVRESHVGNQKINILSVIPIQDVIAKNTVGSIFKQCNKNVISDISIKLTTSDGINVPFVNSVNMFLILHFRLKK